MKEWKKYKLGELITLKYGKDHKKLNDGSFPVYGSGGVMRYGNDYIYDDSSILIPRKGSLNNIMFVDKPFWTVDTMFWSIIDQELVLPRFLYYTLCKYDFAGLNVGSAVPSLTVPVIESIEVVIPSIEKQKRILSLLVPLDDKIALNQRINDNLEQQAQALFKSWFVDFEPFKDGKFINSELGRIPEGWKVEPLINFCSEITRGNIPSYVEKSGFPILNQKVNKGFYLDKQYYKYNAETSQPQESKLAHKWDILLNSLGQGTLGRVHFYKDEKSNIIVDQFITILRANIFIKSAYLAFTLNRPEYQAIIESNITGSTGMWVLTINNIRKIKIVSPPISELSKISNLMENLYLKMNNNTKEQEELSILRDSLLPKLMSGELKINDLNN
jgi:type I restriction enzyme S subunit